MGRGTRVFAGLLLLAAFGAGCATNQLGNPFGTTATGKSSTAAAARKPAADAAVAQKKSPARKSDIVQTSATGRRDGADSTDRSRGESAASRSADDDGFDPKTMAYINRELRDATPDERKELLADLKGLHPDAIRNILRGRRMVKNYDRQQAMLADRSTEKPSQGSAPATGGAPPEIAGSSRRNNAGDASAAAGGNAQQPGTGNRLPGHSLAAVGNDGYQAGPNVTAGGPGAAPLGHSAGYRVDARTGNPIETGSTAPTGPAVRPGRVNQALAQSTAKQQNTTPAIGSSGPQRGPNAKAPLVALGAPLGAGAGPMGTAVAAGIPNDGSPREQLARLISATESETFALQPGETDAEKQVYVEKNVHLRMLYLMSGQQERALQAIPGLDPADQEFWQQTFWGLTNYFDTASIPSSSDRAAQTVTQMTNAVLRLQERANLELRNVSFCHRISSFGNYEKYPREEFSPGQEVLLYAEVANIHSEPIPDGKFRTSLKSTLEIYRHGPQGEMIERIDLPETVDICRTHRRDYFHSYQFTIPTKLALGPHVLKLSVEDQISRRVATYTLNFMVK